MPYISVTSTAYGDYKQLNVSYSDSDYQNETFYPLINFVTWDIIKLVEMFHFLDTPCEHMHKLGYKVSEEYKSSLYYSYLAY
eukprot:snap_masked-scaffold_2-processed-gene-25.29-mRNA-1 protein AED:1.00 eAED:1.00 QI:0/0/0/0/1/1/2/0/81